MISLLFFTASAPEGNDSPVNSKTLLLSYNAVSCNCAQWSATNADKNKLTEYIYLERANSQLIDANKLWDGEHLPLHVKVSGRYLQGVGVPKDYSQTKGKAEPARIFRYEKITVLH